MDPHVRSILRKPAQHLSETLATDDAGAVLHLPVGGDAKDILGAVPELFERVAEADGASLGRATFLGVVSDLDEKLPPLPIVQAGDATFSVVWLLLVDVTWVFASQQLTQLRLERVDRGVVGGLF